MQTKCECTTKNDTMCKRVIAYRIEYVQENGTKTEMTSCGIKCHFDQIVRQIPHDAKVNVFKNNRGTFQQVVFDVDSGDMVNLFDCVRRSVFEGPFTREHTIWRDYKLAKREFKPLQFIMNTRYNVDTISTSYTKRDELKDAINEIMEPYQTSNDLGDFDSEEDLQFVVNDLFAEFNKLNTFLVTYWSFYTDKYKPVSEKFKTAKTIYRKEFHSVQLPWTNELHKECCICLSDTCDTKGGGHLPCGHSFHNKCIQRWIKTKKSSCPMCRATFCVSDTRKNTKRTQSMLTIL